MKKATLFLFALVSLTTYSQNAEILFKENYSKLGLEVGINQLFTKNTPNPALYEWLPSNSFTFGLTYNFYQKENFNFKASLLYSTFNQNTQFVVAGNDGTQSVNNSSSGPYSLLMLPVDMEYYFKISDKSYFSLNTGIELTFNPYGRDEGFSAEGSGYNGNYTSVETYEYSSDFPLYFGFNLGASYNLATKSMLLKFNAKYHNQFQDYIYEGISTVTVNGVASQAKQNLTGDYFGFGVTFIPHKNLFR